MRSPIISASQGENCLNFKQTLWQTVIFVMRHNHRHVHYRPGSLFDTDLQCLIYRPVVCLYIRSPVIFGVCPTVRSSIL